MPRFPRLRFTDTTDFKDAELPELRRPDRVTARSGGSWNFGGGEGGISPPRATRLTSQKEFIRALDLQSVAPSNVTKTFGKMRGNDQLVTGHKASFDNRRSSQAISVALAKHSAKAANVAQRSHAKALAADRRVFNPTSGPKSVYGTQANIKPNSLGRFRFAFPQLSVPCVQRKTRREVLFSKNRTGSGSSSRPKRRGPYSDIGC